MTAKAAKARAVVRLADGRTGRLIYWPLPVSARKDGPARHGTRGARARVQLPSGAVLSVDPAEVTVVEPGNQAPAQKLEQHPWPLAPLLAMVTVDNVARVLGVSGATLAHAREHGLTDRQADTWAVRCGLHPAMVWPGWIEHGLTEGDRQFVFGSEGCEPGWRPAAGYDTPEQIVRAA